MKIKIWGCRGSLAVSGADSSRYGGNTTCLEIRSESGAVIIVDAGSGVHNLGKSIRQEKDIAAIRFLFTHAHWDHLVGFPFFEPAYFSDYSLNFCSGRHSQDSIRCYLSHQMTAPFFPVDFSQLKAHFTFHCDNPCNDSLHCRCGGVEFHAFPVNHPNGGCGYKFMENGKTFIFVPDNELGFSHENGPAREEFVKLFRNADLLIHDAQYTDAEYRHTRSWGHSTYADATDLAVDATARSFGIFHHDPDRTDDDLDRQVEFCRQRISAKGADTHCFAVREGMEIVL